MSVPLLCPVGPRTDPVLEQLVEHAREDVTCLFDAINGHQVQVNAEAVGFENLRAAGVGRCELVTNLLPLQLSRELVLLG